MQEFVCKIDEAAQDEPDIPEPAFIKKVIDTAESLAREVIEAREIITLGLYHIILRKDFSNPGCLLAYACKTPSRRKRVTMDVDQMVETWLPLIKKLACAHDVDEKDAASSELDEHIAPILAAPIVQIREFYRTLTGRLKSDPSVPWAVWRLFEFWGESVLDKIHGEEVHGLKKELASGIADRAIEELPRLDWREAMIGALMWRSPEKLKEIAEKLDAGEKPRLKGKQSCLFLVVGEASQDGKQVEVML
jgi:hypothetical protein